MFIPIPLNWSTECFGTDCGYNLLKEVYFLKSIEIYKSDISHFASLSRCGSPVVFPHFLLLIVPPKAQLLFFRCVSPL